MAVNKLYMLDTNGGIVYFIELVINAIEYGSMIRCFKIPNSADMTTLNYTLPSGATWSNPTTSQTPRVEILSSSFGDLIGFTTGIYPTTTQTTDQVFKSSKVPQIAYINSIIIRCNLLNNKFGAVNDILSSIPLNVKFGGMLNENFDNPTPINIMAGSYQKIEISFWDQNFRKINILDPETVIKLLISVKK